MKNGWETIISENVIVIDQKWKFMSFCCEENRDKFVRLPVVSWKVSIKSLF
jgi:hypothetical protein